MTQNWKKFDPSQLREEQTDVPYQTSASKILSGISPERVIREIKGMLVDPEYFHAETTLRGILATIEKTEHVTQNQWDAIEHIAAAPRREGRHRGSRRF